MSYQDRLKGHLAKYKFARLGISEPGTFSHRGRELSYHHILPLEQRNLNLLEPVRRDVLEYVQANGLQLHKHFHHLNSSQAFAFNLFFPYFEQHREFAPCLLRALGQNGTLTCWQFEWVPDRKEGTNIDVMWRTAEAGITLCEVKLSEADVGSATNDEDHLCKLEKTYAPVLRSHFDSVHLEPSAFFRSYQYYRNVWHMVRTPETSLVFLLPKRNVILWRRLQKLLSATSDEIGERISMVAIEDVLDNLISDRLEPYDLRQYALALGEKYLIQSAETAHDPDVSV